MINFLMKALGVGVIAASVYYCTSAVGMSVVAGVFHFPSLMLVCGVTLGIAILIMDITDFHRFFRFLIGYSSTACQRQAARAEHCFERLVDAYLKDGGDGFQKTVDQYRLPKIWSIVATKLAINIPIPDIQEILDYRVHRAVDRLNQDITTLKQIASLAPAVGMFGSVLGLIRLLADLKDFDTLGANMSLALITTLYGIFLGNIILVPIIRSAEKRKTFYLKNHTNLLYLLDHVQRKKPAFYLKSKLGDFTDAETT